MVARARTLLAVAATAVCASAALTPPAALASHNQEAMFEDTVGILENPAVQLDRLRRLGVERIRLFVAWRNYAPRPDSYRRPRGFDASNPKAYGAVWGALDAAIRQAATDGMSLDVDVGPGAPLWATAPDNPRDKPHAGWSPKGYEYGAFVHALAARYSGNYNPAKNKLVPHDPADLPAVHFWSVWNEPDYGPSLAPQGAPGHLTIERSPWLYRNLLDSAWAALQRTGHAHDSVLLGELAPRGESRLGIFNGMKPLPFVRALYCVDSRYRPLHGTAASVRGCPSTSAGSRAFSRQHPGLFQASGFSIHPYSRWYPPNIEAQPDPDYAALAQIGNLERGLDRALRTYHSHKRYPIWNTEYGYLTSPPKRSPDPMNHVPYIRQSTAAYFLNWAEYISWRDPRIASFMQYLLADPLPAIRSNDYGGFASGLLTFAQKEKPAYGAFRVPLYLPVTSSRRGRSLEVWGDARPAHWGMIDVPADPETVEIQFKPSSGGSFTVVKTVTVTDPHGYFDTRVSFPGSGTVRVSYTYPSDDPLLSPGDTVFSRNVGITLK
jgi:hypothetical protein